MNSSEPARSSMLQQDEIAAAITYFLSGPQSQGQLGVAMIAAADEEDVSLSMESNRFGDEREIAIPPNQPELSSKTVTLQTPTRSSWAM